jgi:GDPmannose 4,6-dehydratase
VNSIPTENLGTNGWKVTGSEQNRRDKAVPPVRTALITGITGQDGSYLAELLLDKGYLVHGLVRSASNTHRLRSAGLISNPEVFNRRLFLHYGELDDATNIRRILQRTEPDELYHLAGQSHVGLSFELAESTCQATAMGTLRLLEIIRDLDKRPRFLHSSSSEIFGDPAVSPQNEQTPFNPITPYGAAKCFATQMVRIYRDSYDLFVSNAICYNHESPRRDESFVTRKITRGAAEIKLGLRNKLCLGNLEASRDWGYAKDFVVAMWKILQHVEPDDFVIGTGESHTVREFLEVAFAEAGLDWREHVEIDPRHFRRRDIDSLVGDGTRARERLGWTPDTTFNQLAKLMIDHDLDLAAREPGESARNGAPAAPGGR